MQICDHCGSKTWDDDVEVIIMRQFRSNTNDALGRRGIEKLANDA
jgi:hypothetical protein